MKSANEEHPMRRISVEKLTLNIGTGKDQSQLNKGIILLKHITGIDPVKTVTQKRIPAWGLRPGLPIGCKLTLRGQKALELIPRLLSAVDNKLNGNNFDDFGNVSFGIKEYIDIAGLKYNHDVGIMGLQVTLTLQRPGFRIKKRKLQRRKITERHKIKRNDATDFIKKTFNVMIGEAE